MGTTVDLTKVNLEPKAFVFLTIAFTVVLLAYGLGTVGARKVKELVKGAAGGAIPEVEEW